MRHTCACGDACCLPLLFPSLTNVEIVHVAVTEKCVLISARDVVVI
jgi:hypothetical protein